MSNDQIEREITIAAPVERVWALVTEAEHLGTWFGDAGAEVDLRPGGSMVLRWAEHGAVHATIERVEPYSRFSYRWAPYRDPGGREPTAENATLVEFWLQPDDGGTRLRVVESGFDALACSPQQRIHNRAANVEGWLLELGELGEHAARVLA